MPPPIQESSGKALVDGRFCSISTASSSANKFGFGDSRFGVAKQLMHISRRMDSVWQVLFMVFTLIALLCVVCIALATTNQICEFSFHN